MKTFLSKTFLKYLFRFGFVFSCLYFGTLLIIGLSSKDNLYSPFVSDYLDYITPLRSAILHSANSLLHIVGYPSVIGDEYTILFVNGGGVRIVYSCVAYGVLSFWIAFVVANRGNLYRKLIWAVGGCILLFFLNLIRISLLLVAINKNWNIPFNVNHHTLFNVLAYSLIFLMIYSYDRSLLHEVSHATIETASI